jgi:uncharacterized protein YunC (DUF1805 family)
LGIAQSATADKTEEARNHSATADKKEVKTMEVHTKTYQTPNGPVEAVQTKWQGFNILLATGTKGFLACPAIDVEACQRYGVAAAIVESTPDNPIGTLERFPERKVTKANAKAKELGVKEGMNASDAFTLVA